MLTFLVFCQSFPHHPLLIICHCFLPFIITRSRNLTHMPLEPQPFLHRLCQVLHTLAGLFQPNTIRLYISAQALRHICLLPTEYCILSTTLFLSISIFPFSPNLPFALSLALSKMTNQSFVLLLPFRIFAPSPFCLSPKESFEHLSSFIIRHSIVRHSLFIFLPVSPSPFLPATRPAPSAIVYCQL